MDIMKHGELVVLEKLVDFEESLENNTQKIEDTIIKAQEDVSHLISSAREEVDTKLAELKNGEDFTPTEEDLQKIADKVHIPIVEKTIEKTTIIKEQPIVTEVTKVIKETKEVAIPQTPDETVDKVNASDKAIQQDRVENLQKDLSEIRNIAVANSVPVTTSFFNGLRAKNLNIIGGTVSQSGDTVNVTVSSGGGHTIQDEGVPLTQRSNLNFVGAGVTVTDDAGNNATVVTVSTSAGAGYQVPSSGAVNGTNKVFVWAVAPNAIVVDGVSLRKTASDGTVNWTGTTTTTLLIAPNFDTYGVA